MNRNPDSERIRRQICLFVGFFALALLVLDFPKQVSAVQKQTKQATALYSEAAGLQNAGEFELALEIWDQFAEKFPEDTRIVKARHYQGVCCMQLKKIEAASDAFAFVVDQLDDQPNFPQAEDAMLNLGWCRFHLAQQADNDNELLESAAKDFREQLKKFPEGKLADQGWYFLGESLYLSGKTEESVEAYQRVVDDFDKSNLRTNAMYALGVALQELNRNEPARATFEQFASEFSENELILEVRLRIAETVLQTAIVERDAGRQDAANKRFSEAAGLFANLVRQDDFDQADHALYQQAYCLIGQQKYGDAARAYSELAENFSDSQYARESTLAAGKFFYKANESEDARKWLSKAASEKSNPATATEAAHWLARLLIAKGESGTAASVVEKQLSEADGPFQNDLSMDLADALYQQESERERAFKLYLEIADKHADSDLAPQATYNAAYTALELKEYDKAIELADRFEEKYSDDELIHDVRYVRAESFLMTGKPEQAEKIYSELVNRKDHPDVRSWRVRYAMSRYLQKQYQETLDLLIDEVDNFQRPSKTEAEYLIGASNFFLKRYEPASQWLNRRLKSDPESKQNDEILLLLAQSSYHQKTFDLAIKQLRQLKADFPKTEYLAQANYYLGQSATAKTDFRDAISYYAAVIDADESDLTPYAIFGKAWAQQKSGNDKESIAGFTQFLEKYNDHPLFADALRSRGVARRNSGDHERALHDLEDSIKIAGKNPESQYEMGLTQVALKEYSRAIETFEKIVSTQTAGEDTDDLADDALYQLAWAYKYSDDMASAVKHFDELRTRFGDSPFAAEAAFHVGEFAYGENDFSAAGKSYLNARDRSEDDDRQQDLNEKARFKLGWSYFKQDEFEKAVRAFQEQVNVHPDGTLVVDAMFMVAESKFQQGDYGNALKSFNFVLPRIQDAPKTAESIKLLTRLHGAKSANQSKKYRDTANYLESSTAIEELFGESDYLADAWLEYGLGMKGRKDHDQAIKAFENAALESSGPTGAQARCMIGEVLFATKKHEDAIKNYKRVMYGYGGQNADDEIKKWQVLAGYEAGRCASVLIGKTSDQTKKAELIKQAKSLFNYVIEKHAGHDLAAESRTEISKLERM